MVTYCFSTTGTISKNCRRKKRAINDAPNDEGNYTKLLSFFKYLHIQAHYLKRDILNVGYIIDGEHLTKEELTHLVSPSSTTKSVKDTLQRNERSARESKMGQQSVPLSKIEELNQVCSIYLNVDL